MNRTLQYLTVAPALSLPFVYIHTWNPFSVNGPDFLGFYITLITDRLPVPCYQEAFFIAGPWYSQDNAGFVQRKTCFISLTSRCVEHCLNFKYKCKHMEDSEKLKRIVDARMKLKARFEDKMQNTPSVADNRPMGKGSPNRHGMPVIPVGQTLTVKWPVLDLGIQPDIPLNEWRLIIDGDVESPVELTWEDFLACLKQKIHQTFTA